MRSYEPYCSNLLLATNLFFFLTRKAKACEPFNTWLEQMEALPILHGEEVLSLLARPFVQLYKYSMFIRHFMRLTPEPSEDYDELKEVR